MHARAALIDFPGAPPVKREMVRTRARYGSHEVAALRISDNDWGGYRTMSLCIFHTPANAIPDLPPGVPVVADIQPV